MTLSGVDPNDPIPSVRRELIFGAGPGSSGVTRDVIIYGNKTASGTETENTLGTPIADDQDAQDRFGPRSEWYAMYRQFVDVDNTATVYGIAVPAATGTASSVELGTSSRSSCNTFANKKSSNVDQMACTSS